MFNRIMSNGDVYLKRTMYVPHINEPVRSAFCPLMSFLQVNYVAMTTQTVTVD